MVHLVVSFHFGVLQCMLRVYPCEDVGTGWKGKDSGWGRRREGVISLCKDSKKIDDVNTARGYYLIYLCK